MKSRFLLAAPSVLACLALACGESDTVTVIPIAAGAACPNGGIQITVNGGAPHVVCNGTNGTPGSNGVDGGAGSNGNNGANGGDGYSTLFVTKTLPAGDASCATGGQEIESGLDNGANGGIARDGVLQQGEVLNTSYVCNGGGYHVGSIVPPPGAAGTSTIRALGGDGADGGAGNGGLIQAGFQNGTAGGHVKVFETGAADPSFSFPAQPATDLGAHPALVTRDTTVGPLLSDAGTGALFIDSSGSLRILETVSDGGSVAATGLSVAASVTLSIDPLAEVAILREARNTVQPAELYVGGGCVNSGTVRVVAGVSTALDFKCQSYFGATGSHVTNDGADSESAGKNGQGLFLHGDVIWNHGDISANGGKGTSGGNAGYVFVSATGNDFGPLALYNSGAISARGGQGTHGAGGGGANVQLQSLGDVNNSGALDASGGSGTTSGGSGSGIDFQAGQQSGRGSVRNAGAITASGGAVDASCNSADGGAGTPCSAGNGGTISFDVGDGTLVNNASLTSTGGGSPSGSAGSGGQIHASVFGSGNSPFAAGNLTFSGSVDASGGAGLNGGNGGQFTAQMNAGQQPNGQEIILYGYARLDVSGGNSASAAGGAGGEIDLFNIDYSQNRGLFRGTQQTNPGPGGSVVNYVPLLANGGAGNSAVTSTASRGGNGGNISLTTQSTNFYPDDNFEQVISAGALSLIGGSGNNGGTGGTPYIYGNTGAVVSGAIDARGGAAPAPPRANGDAPQNGIAGSGQQVQIQSDNGVVVNTASLNGSGGQGSYRGGDSGGLTLLGKSVIDSASLTFAGGAVTGAASNAYGGAGGVVTLTSNGGGLTQVTAALKTGISVAGGVAPVTGTPGSSGEVIIDSWNVTSAWTH